MMRKTSIFTAIMVFGSFFLIAQNDFNETQMNDDQYLYFGDGNDVGMRWNNSSSYLQVNGDSSGTLTQIIAGVADTQGINLDILSGSASVDSSISFEMPPDDDSVVYRYVLTTDYQNSLAYFVLDAEGTGNGNQRMFEVISASGDGVTLRIGEDDVNNAAVLRLYGALTGEGAEFVMHNGADSDTEVNTWTFYADDTQAVADTNLVDGGFGLFAKGGTVGGSPGGSPIWTVDDSDLGMHIQQDLEITGDVDLIGNDIEASTFTITDGTNDLELSMDSGVAVLRSEASKNSALHVDTTDADGTKNAVATFYGDGKRGDANYSIAAFGYKSSGSLYGIDMAEAGSGAVRDFNIVDSSNTSFYWDRTNNYVGIATASPLHDVTIGGDVHIQERLMTNQGTDTASATAVSFPTNGNVINITGTTTIDHISGSNWEDGSVVILRFASTPTVNHNTATSGTDYGIFLKGKANQAMAADDVLHLCLIDDGTTKHWFEL